MSEAASIYVRLIGARIRSDAQYRTTFVLRIVSAALITGSDYISIWALLATTGTIGGWSRWQVTFLYGASSCAFRLADAFVGGPVERCAQYVRMGTFDKFLTRPAGAFLQVLGEDFAFRRVGQFAAMVPFLLVSLAQLDVAWTVGRALFLFAVLLGAALLSCGVFVLVSCLAFWSPNTGEIANAFTYGGATIAEYPVHVMAGWLRNLAFTLVPVAYMAYLPSFVLFDAPNPLGVPRWASYASPFAFVPVCALSIVVWRFAVRRYRSTGS